MSVTQAGTAVANRLDAALDRRRPALICYLPLGDPAVPADLAAIYVAGGVDVLEVGLPVPNPYLDGATIRESMTRAQEAGVTFPRASQLTARLRGRHPEQAMVWMSYGSVVPGDAFAGLAVSAGVDGVLFPEPARHFARLARELARHRIHLLHFLARDLPPADVAAATDSRGYVMVQAIAGATGTGDADNALPDSSKLIARLHAAGVTTPIALGVGISSPDQARQAVDMGADAVIVGSAVVEHAVQGVEAVTGFIADLRNALA